MKISFLPRYARTAASSRLRVFAIADAINRRGLAEAVIGYDSDADVLVVQKAIDQKVFALARAHRGVVVYDVDDVIDLRTLARAAEVAQVITTDTDGRAADLSRWLQFSAPVPVVPDALDYEHSGPQPVTEGLGAVWFGNYPNFESARWMMEALQAHNVPTGAISDLTRERAAMPQLRLSPWDPITFVRAFRQWSVAVLSHRDSDTNKSNNKMAAAYHLGVPCITSHSPEYFRLARECGLGWTYVVTERELKAAWERLQDPAERAAAVAAVQPVIWERYRADAVARIALNAYEGALVHH